MRIAELQPQWVNAAEHGSLFRHGDAHSHVTYSEDEEPGSTESLVDAQGVMFLCPACFRKNNGPIGTESVICWFAGKGVPDDAIPGPGRWTATGSSFDDLTLTPSVNVDHEHWHGWITSGQVAP